MWVWSCKLYRHLLCYHRDSMSNIMVLVSADLKHNLLCNGLCAHVFNPAEC